MYTKVEHTRLYNFKQITETQDMWKLTNYKLLPHSLRAQIQYIIVLKI